MALTEMEKDMDESPRLNAALAKLQRMAADNPPLGSRVTAEQEYADAYDEMVRRGTRRKLRAKYRRG